jgi:hypothetical protein
MIKNQFLIGTLSILFFSVLACKKTEGTAPSTGYSSISINPLAIIVPKSTTFKISVLGTSYSDGSEIDITSSSQCTVDNAIAAISADGSLSNTYTGTSVQRLNLTCVYEGMTKTVPVTIVPAVLTSLVFTKNNLLMGPGQSQSIQVYGNFTDVNSYVFALDMTNYITWSSSNSSTSSAMLGTVSAGAVGSANLTAAFGSINASTSVTVSTSTTTPSATPKGVGLLGSYYDFSTGVPWSNSTIGDPFETLYGQRIDSQVYFNWSTGTNNLGQVAYFGIRWTGRIYIPTTGSYTFYTDSDDGIRLWIDDVQGAPAIDNWTLHAGTEDTTTMTLNGGSFYNVKIDYFENAGYSQAELRWSGPSITKALIPQIYLFPN